MNKLSATIILMFLVFPSIVSACGKVAEGYEDRDKMYVVCPNLSNLSNDDASQLVLNVMNQYKGPPDEVIVYFVSSKKVVGKPEAEINAMELVGYYYTHSHQLIVWPKLKTLKKVVEITW